MIHIRLLNSLLFTPLSRAPVGPLCQSNDSAASLAILTNCTATLIDYERALTTPDSTCGASATSNRFEWTPNDTTPDVLYYQVGVVYQ